MQIQFLERQLGHCLSASELRHGRILSLDPTFEADPIGRRLECLPKKGININFTLFFNVFLMGPRGPQGLIK